jgi:EmrB/QacA subfamily drug resistance transporter
MLSSPRACPERSRRPVPAADAAIAFRAVARSGVSTRTAAAGTASGVVVVMTLANAMILVDQTAVPLALPAIVEHFGVRASLAQWVMTASLLPLAGLLVLGGRLGDVFGRRRTFLTGVLLFGLASAVGGLAPTFSVLLACRVVQGIGGALMLPATVAIVSATVSPAEQGRMLGTMAGVAAIAAALGPTIGGVITSALTWRAVLLVCVPLVAIIYLLTVRAVPSDLVRPRRSEADQPRMSDIDLAGAALLCCTLVCIVVGLSQTQNHSIDSPIVWLPALTALATAALFVRRESVAAVPLVSFRLLQEHPGYLASTASQTLSGAVALGLGVILPLILILNLDMAPAKAGLALLPTTVPLIVLAPFVGRWYDKVGSRIPMVVGFAVLAVAALLLAFGVSDPAYAALFPGLAAYGIALAIIVTVNNPVDEVPRASRGEAAGVQATAEQAGGAIGVAALYAIFHSIYSYDLRTRVDASRLHDLTRSDYKAFENAVIAAERTGLDPKQFDPAYARYLGIARTASEHGYTAVFLTVATLAALGILTAAKLATSRGENSTLADRPLPPGDRRGARSAEGGLDSK